MENIEKKAILDKMVRELEDITNSQTSVLKKIGQLEAENINLSNTVLGKGLPEIYEHADQALTEMSSLQAEFTEARDKFVTDNNLEEIGINAE